MTGERFTFIETAASTDGERLAFELGLRPGGAVPIPHVHPIQTERFEILGGTMRFASAPSRLADPGDVVEVQPGVVHGFANAGERDARSGGGEARPAMEEMFTEVVAMAEAGRMGRAGCRGTSSTSRRSPGATTARRHAPVLGVAAQRLLLAPLVFAAEHSADLRRLPPDRRYRPEPDRTEGATDVRCDLRPHLRRGARLCAGSRGLLRLLDVRDGGPRPKLGRDRRGGDAGHQSCGARPRADDGPVRHRGAVPGGRSGRAAGNAGADGGLAVAGAAAYLAGVVGVTMTCNVPLNERLDRVDPEGLEAAREWSRYERRWRAWNHVRTLGGLAATAGMIATMAA